MNRRSLLASLPAVAVAAPASALCAIDPDETPVAALFREWEVQSALVSDACIRKDLSESEFDAILNKRIEIEDKIFATPARNAHDFLLKVFARCCGGEYDLPLMYVASEFWDEARALIG